MKRCQTENALETIELEPANIEYYFFRSRVLDKLKNQVAAIMDYSRFTDAGREEVASLYFAEFYTGQVHDYLICINYADDVFIQLAYDENQSFFQYFIVILRLIWERVK